MPIKIECKGYVTEESIMKTCNFAFKEPGLSSKDEIPAEFGYSLFFEFQGHMKKEEEILIVHVQGKHVRP